MEPKRPPGRIGPGSSRWRCGEVLGVGCNRLVCLVWSIGAGY